MVDQNKLAGWDIETVMKEQERVEREEPETPFYAQPLAKWDALQRIEVERQRYVAGDQNALMSAIACCAGHDLIMPDWVSKGFRKAYYSVAHFHTASWDEAFGAPHRKGTHLDKARQRWELRPQIWLYVRELKSKGVPTDPALFETVAEKFGIGRRQAEDLYYSAKKNFVP